MKLETLTLVRIRKGNLAMKFETLTQMRIQRVYSVCGLRVSVWFFCFCFSVLCFWFGIFLRRDKLNNNFRKIALFGKVFQNPFPFPNTKNSFNISYSNLFLNLALTTNTFFLNKPQNSFLNIKHLISINWEFETLFTWYLYI